MDQQQQQQKNPKKKIRTARSLSSTLSSDFADYEISPEPVNRSCSSGCDSEEDSVVTSEKSVVQKQNGNSRGHKQSSKDPQSLYAKRRRERINRRLRILQQLIPNGSKVDISRGSSSVCYFPVTNKGSGVVIFP
ncbi:hypothetical protein ABZP36_009344 [Zizania latifolia]